MNFFTKFTLWGGLQAMKTMKYVRLYHKTMSNLLPGCIPFEDKLIQSGYKNTRAKVGKTRIDAVACVPNTEVIKVLNDTPLSIYKKPSKKTKTEKDLLRYLKTYFTQEMIYHKSLQKINKTASRRIKKIIRKM